MGIRVGDIVAPKAHLSISENDYIKSRFLDDKGSVALLMAIIEYIVDNNIKLNRSIDFYFTAFEEIGHGGAILPADACDVIAVEIAPTGGNQLSDEHKCTISPKFGHIPSNRALTRELIECADKYEIPYVLDLLQSGGTDCNSAIVSGNDIRHTVIGFGAFASHGYERTHIDSLNALYDLLMHFIEAV